MYLSEKTRQLDFYKEDDDRNLNLIIEAVSNNGELQNHHQRMLLGDSSSEDHDVSNNNNNNCNNNNNNNNNNNSNHSSNKAPKKRAETWIQDETRSLIAFRRDMDGLFNTSKSNKHLWEQISSKMRENGFDRSPTMCTDKWRNLLKEFKKAKHQDRGGGSGKMSCYKEIDEILKERNRNAHYKAAKVDSFMQFSDKGMEDTSISFASLEANGRPTLNLGRCLDHDGDPLAITAPEPGVGNGVPPCDWTVPPRDGGENPSYGGRVITVKWGDYTRRIGIDGSVDAIKESIKSVFGLRTRRAFWLEDQDGIVRSLDRDMPLQEYNLQLDEGISIKVCLYDQSDRIVVHTEDRTFYTDEDFREFLNRRGWTCLRDINGYGSFGNLDNLRSGEMYRGVN